MLSSQSPSASSAGSERLKADMRQFGGLILALGICAMFGALSGVASGAGRDGGTPNENGIPLWSFIGACCQAFFGAIAIVVGYLSIVGDTGHRYLTFALCLSIQLAYIPYVTGMAGVGKQAANPDTQQLIPTDLKPTDDDVRFIGAMGILTVMAHGFAFIGSLSFMAFALLAYQSQKYQDRAARYFHGRLITYSLPLVLAGFAQLAIGSYALAKYGNGPYAQPINVTVLTIFFPGISVFVGIVQLLTGFVGVARYLNRDFMERFGPWSFQIMCGFMWFVMMILQLMVQVSFAPSDQFAAAAPTRACLFFGFALMPAYLDYKMRNTPKLMEQSYYAAPAEEQVDVKKNDTFAEEAPIEDVEAGGSIAEKNDDADVDTA